MDWIEERQKDAALSDKQKKCEHKRKSTNRTPLVTVTWCLDCGKLLETKKRRYES